MKLDLADLKPTEATFSLDDFPGQTFTLKKFSLNAQLWVNERFGAEAVQGIFADSKMGEISEIVFFLLKDKSVINSLEKLRESISTQQDRVAILSALLETIGISQPVIDKIASQDMGNAESLNP